MIVALVIGISAAIYLSEYSRDTHFIRFIRVAIFKSCRRAFDRVRPVRFWVVRNLFWLERFAHRGLVHAGSDDFARDHYASEESLRAVPKGLREGSLALGATSWQTIRKNVLPYAMPAF
jgi:phosphate transport system permease protein